MKILNNRMDRQFAMHKDAYMNKVEKILDSGNYVLGEEVKSFESEYAAYNDVKYCVGCANCLDALTMSFSVVKKEKQQGNEVIVPANTFIATIMGITKNGLKPIFVEPDEYFNLDADKLEAAINEKTIAICVVHLYGQLANMPKIMQVAKKHNLMVVEDCAQAHNASLNGKKAGSFGDIGCISFYPTKNLGGFGDGGCLLTNNEKWANEFKMMRNYGSSKTYHFDTIGMNSRLDEIQAGLLRVKLRYFDEYVLERRNIANRYINEIMNHKIELPKLRFGIEGHVFHLFVAIVKDRNDFFEYCGKNEIGLNVHYPIPPHLSNAYKNLGFKTGDLPITEEYANRVVSLPIYNGMTEDEIDYVITTLNRY